MESRAGTAGQAGAAGAGRGSRLGMVIHLCDEIALDNCLRILFQRQEWFLNVWQISRKRTLPKLEIRLRDERILVVFFLRGRLLSLANRIRLFSRVIVIVNGHPDHADILEVASLGSFARKWSMINDQEFTRRFGVIEGKSSIPLKFSGYSSINIEEALEEFCRVVEEGLNSSFLRSGVLPQFSWSDQ